MNPVFGISGIAWKASAYELYIGGEGLRACKSRVPITGYHPLCRVRAGGIRLETAPDQNPLSRLSFFGEGAVCARAPARFYMTGHLKFLSSHKTHRPDHFTPCICFTTKSILGSFFPDELSNRIPLHVPRLRLCH